MITPNAMDRVKVKAMQSTTRDGITEILLGSMLLFFGVVFYWAPALGAFGALLPLALAPLGKHMKRRFVYPRIGYARVAQQPHAWRGIALSAVVFVIFILLALGLFALVLGFERGYSLWLSHFVPAVAGVLMAIGPWVIARTYHLTRWYAFAALFVVMGISLPLLGIATGYSAVALESAVVGGLSLIYGLGLFLTFLRKVPHSEVGDAATQG